MIIYIFDIKTSLYFMTSILRKMIGLLIITNTDKAHEPQKFLFLLSVTFPKV